MHAGPEYVARAVRGGADAYLLKDSAVQDLVAALEAVAGGAHATSARRFSSSWPPGARRRAPAPAPTALTDREREVLALAGARPVEPGGRRASSTSASRTVETHRANLMHKLGVKSVALLIQVAIREGILDPLPQSP